MSEQEQILFEREGPVAYLTLNRPQQRTPVNNGAKLRQMELLERCDYDEEIRAVVLRGAGGTFSSGGDLAAMRRRNERGELGAQTRCRLAGEMNTRLRNLSKPAIAWAEGAVTGAGMCLMLSCDFQIAADDTKMAFPFVNIGYVPDSGATYLVTRAVGTVRATDLLMSGRRFTGREAAQWGLVTEAVPHGQLEERVRAYARKYSVGPSVAYAGIKSMINEAQFSGFGAGIQREVALQGRCEQTEDFQTAIQAFFQKSHPEFRGR